MSRTEFQQLGQKLLPWAANTICGFLIWWAMQLNQQLGTLQRDMQMMREWKAETAANRYTSQDHAAYAEAQAIELQKLWQRIADLQQVWLKDVSDIKIKLEGMPKRDDLPPVWFRDYVKTIDDRVRTLESNKLLK